MKNQATSIKYGIITGIFLIGYFYLLGTLGYIKSPAYSLFNALICALGIFMAISEKSQTSHFDPKIGFKTGIQTGLIATVIFTIFFGFYAKNQDGFMSALSDQIGFINLNYFLLIILVALGGVVSVYAVTYILVKTFSKSWSVE